MIYKLVFYNYYSFVNFWGKSSKSFYFSNPRIDTIFVLTFFETLNVMTLFKGFDISLGTKNNYPELLVIGTLIGIINYWVLVKDNKYKRILEEVKMEKESVQLLGKIGTLTYSLTTFFLVYYVTK